MAESSSSFVFGGRIAGVRTVFSEMDARCRRFASRTGIECLPGCGACCLSTEVEASVLEMLPMAEVILQRGEAELWLARIEASGRQGPCVVYQPDSVDGSLGRCRFYPERAALCRLFGFSATRGKHGELWFRPCRRLRGTVPEWRAGACSLEARGEDAPPVFEEMLRQLVAVDPSMGTRLLPINEALARAIEWLGLRSTLAA